MSILLPVLKIDHPIVIDTSLVFFDIRFFFFWQPAKTQGGYYCAVVIFGSSVEANQAFENVNGYKETVL